ncbi:MAG TPA: Ku protein [Burkholderiaceae bacterium]|nr:Ku protein [Burkholderiaceae bacterium]
MAHALWKGAISFGLVHIPVELHGASKQDDIDFDWLDKRDLKPVGYKRVNKETGEEVTKDDIVKGVKVESGDYVVLSDEEIRAANPQASQLVEILAFVKAAEIDPVYFETPYTLAPILRGEKVYALLRETLARADKVGIARVVMHNKQHLAALLPAGPLLRLITLRWQNEIRPAPSDIDQPPVNARAAGLTQRELEMATALVEDMTEPFKPDRYSDSFRDDILKLIDRKVRAGQTHTVTLQEEAPAAPETTSDLADLAALLKRSLQGRGSLARDRASAREHASARAEHDGTHRRAKRA